MFHVWMDRTVFALHPSMDMWVVSTLWRLWLTLLVSWGCKYPCVSQYSFFFFLAELEQT